MRTRILGISTEPTALSAAVVLENRVVSAVEQFKIREHWSPKESTVLPKEAVIASLQIAHLDPSEIDVVAFTSEVGAEKTIISQLRGLGLNGHARLEHVDHRIAHAAAAFYSSPFDRAAILILGSGPESSLTCFAIG